MPGTIAGVAVSGGKARASLPGVLGKIDADVFQAGLYGMTQLGPVKLGAALSYARLENDVSRSIPVLGSSLASSYATTAWSGRLQANTALLGWNGLSLSPLAAIQSTRAHSPAVIEANWGGAKCRSAGSGQAQRHHRARRTGRTGRQRHGTRRCPHHRLCPGGLGALLSPRCRSDGELGRPAWRGVHGDWRRARPQQRARQSRRHRQAQRTHDARRQLRRGVLRQQQSPWWIGPDQGEFLTKRGRRPGCAKPRRRSRFGCPVTVTAADLLPAPFIPSEDMVHPYARSRVTEPASQRVNA